MATQRDDRLRHTVMDRRVREELTGLRKSLDWSRQRVADKAGVEVRTVARIESGSAPVSPGNLALLCDVYAVRQDERDKLRAMNQIARSIGWWDAWQDARLKPVYAEHIELEELSDWMGFYSPTLMAGFLQCAEYANFIQLRARRLSATGHTAERLVGLRLERQRRLFQRHGVGIQVLLDRTAFLGVPPEVVAAQTDFMSQLAAEGRVQFRAAPDSTRLSLGGTIYLFTAYGRTTVCASTGMDFHVEATVEPEYVESLLGNFYEQWEKATAVSDSDWKSFT